MRRFKNCYFCEKETDEVDLFECEECFQHGCEDCVSYTVTESLYCKECTDDGLYDHDKKADDADRMESFK